MVCWQSAAIITYGSILLFGESRKCASFCCGLVRAMIVCDCLCVVKFWVRHALDIFNWFETDIRRTGGKYKSQNESVKNTGHNETPTKQSFAFWLAF